MKTTLNYSIKMFRVKIFKAHMDFIIWFYGTLEATFCQVWYKMIYHLIEMMINSLTNRLQINREKEWWAYFSNLAGYFSSIKSLLQGDFATFCQLVSRLNQSYTFWEFHIKALNKIEHQFLNSEQTRTCSSISNRTWTLYFWLQMNGHRTSNLIESNIWLTNYASNRL